MLIDKDRLGNWPWVSTGAPLTPSNVVAAHKLVDAVEERKHQRADTCAKMAVALRRIDLLLSGHPSDEELHEAQMLARAACDRADEAGL